VEEPVASLESSAFAEFALGKWQTRERFPELESLKKYHEY